MGHSNMDTALDVYTALQRCVREGLPEPLRSLRSVSDQPGELRARGTQQPDVHHRGLWNRVLSAMKLGDFGRASSIAI